jgi:hypothetical protein
MLRPFNFQSGNHGLPANEEKALHFQTLRSVERILISEYEERRLEFAHAQSEPIAGGHLKATFENYIEAMRRLRQFFGSGEIPAEIKDKLPKR